MVASTYEERKSRSRDLLRVHNVRLMRKDESVLMRLVAKVLFWNPGFMTKYWSTITLPGYRWMFYESDITIEEALGKVWIVTHECEHVAQADGPFPYFDPLRWACNLIYAALYLLAPLPIGLALFRGWFEARAFAVEYVARIDYGITRLSPERFASWGGNLISGSVYVWAVPAEWARRWILDRIAEIRGEGF